MSTINDGSNKSSLFIRVSYGDASGSRPIGTGSAQGSVLAGVHKSGGAVAQGDADIVIISGFLHLCQFLGIVITQFLQLVI